MSDLCVAIAVSRPDDLNPIPGAIPSAKRLVAWARAMGYDTELITDADEPVTSERLRQIFAEKLGQGGQRRLIVAFAGHGLIRGGAEEYWLLNNWKNQATGAVNYLKLRDRLKTYLPRQLAMISDACRSLPNDKAKWVEGNGIVDVTDYEERPVQVAQLVGTTAAQPAFSTPMGAEEAYCFFTHVLVDTLCGVHPEAIEDVEKIGRAVTNDKLLDVVEREVPKLADRYRRRQQPELYGGWRSPDNVWSELDKIGADKIPSFSQPPVALIQRDGEAPRPDTRERSAQARAKSFVSRLQDEERATHFKPDAGLVVIGREVTEVAVGSNFRCERDHGGVAWFRLFPIEGDATSVMARLSDGTWVAAAAYRDFIGTFTVDADGAESYILRQPSGGSSAELAVARASAGSTFGDPYELAARLRDYKHTDPVLGALAAYAYARAGAIEEIRRLVYFYAEHDQPAPFDAVLLARVNVSRDGLGWIAHIPPVEERTPRSPEESRRSWTYRSTPAANVRVAGGFPWLRQGWALLDDDFRPKFRELARFAPRVKPSFVTTLDAAEGSELAALIRNGEV